MDAARRAFLLGNRSFSATLASASPRRAQIGEDCLAHQGVVCRTCGDHCDADAIVFTPRPGGTALPRLLAERCTGCGDCAADCPALAIAMCAAETHPSRT